MEEEVSGVGRREKGQEVPKSGGGSQKARGIKSLFWRRIFFRLLFLSFLFFWRPLTSP